jgi:hypothetical protein
MDTPGEKPRTLSTAAEIGVKLTIISETVTASEMDEYIGIQCTDSQKRGELNRLGTKCYEHNVWFYKSRYNVPQDEYIGDRIASQIDQLLSKLKVKADRIKKLSRDNSVIFGLYFYVQSIPPLSLTREQLENVAELGAKLDIDVILYGDSHGAE